MSRRRTKPQNVIDFAAARASRKPHEAGPAGCRACKYRIVQVVPVVRERGGSECPRCGEFEVFFEFSGEEFCDGMLDDREDQPRCLRPYTREESSSGQVPGRKE